METKPIIPKYSIKRAILILTIIILFFLCFGTNLFYLIGLFIPYAVIILVLEGIDLYRFRTWKKIFLKGVEISFMLFLIIRGVEFHKNHGAIEFDADIKKIETYFLENGVYPEKLSDALINPNPYFSFFGPYYVYTGIGTKISKMPEEERTIERIKSVVFCRMIFSPFGRECYNINKKEKIYLD